MLDTGELESRLPVVRAERFATERSTLRCGEDKRVGLRAGAFGEMFGEKVAEESRDHDGAPLIGLRRTEVNSTPNL